MKIEDAVRYDPETGKLFWKIRCSTRVDVGGEAGSDFDRYRRFQLKGKMYLAHRVAWYLMTGKWPVQVDHIDGNTKNNKWSNLRECNSFINNQNRSCHRNGKKWGANPLRGKWQASFGYKRKNVYVGIFDTELEAAAASYGYLKGAGLLEHFNFSEKEN